MSEAMFTQGPYRRSPADSLVIEGGPDYGTKIATVALDGDPHSPGHNADLLKAAPDLYAVVAEAVRIACLPLELEAEAIAALARADGVKP